MRIALFFDGTWNAPWAHTNIWDLYRRTPQREGVQHTRYLAGVGLRPPLLGGAVAGIGIDERIRTGYAEIARHWSPGDELYLVGFSRGAFSARSLAGMIAKCGIVPPGTPRLSAKDLFERYRDRKRPGLREMRATPSLAVDDEDRQVLAHAEQARIRFVGAFDTVGGLGLPGPLAALTAGSYRFHDTALSGLVDVARHAVALDELRSYFPATLWDSVPIPTETPTDVEQRWFVGGHSNVGGGPTTGLWSDRQLSTLPREWIADEAAAAGLEIEPGKPADDAALGRIERADHSPIFAPLGLLPGLGFGRREVRKSGIAEVLDPSVGTRWQEDPAYRARKAPRARGLRRWITDLGWT
ncbi:DUF2235 domain-containing protein [Pseudonocardia pini]|uniref:DUF2235 domain-containing protein n=1 Tax=Pseudonocardia pini TaxID=2758030 RepID=UPI0015F07A7F|nr:DUF2235 domain-containing protein [Pseudonocardia pini]